MNYLSVCSGIEAASVAWLPLGWHAVGFSEIDPFPSAVLQYRFSDVPNFGDMSKYMEWEIGKTIDLVVGGTPCQDFSFAGLRSGGKGSRGQLSYVFIELVAFFRPQWLVWENVPGVLSASSGHDFGTFIQGLADLGYSLSWRVLDAQYFGVPQHRSRIYLVGYLGSDARMSAKVLFEPEMLSRNFAPRVSKGQVTPGKAGISPAVFLHNSRNIGNGVGYNEKIAPTLLAKKNGTAAVLYDISYSRITQCTRVAPCVLSHYDSGGAHTPFVHQDTVLRRITPTECERLQGFPDNWTAVPWKGKFSESCPDGLRYKAIGNSMAVPVIRWIGDRIKLVEECQR